MPAFRRQPQPRILVKSSDPWTVAGELIITLGQFNKRESQLFQTRFNRLYVQHQSAVELFLSDHVCEHNHRVATGDIADLVWVLVNEVAKRLDYRSARGLTFHQNRHSEWGWFPPHPVNLNT